ncbi:MAG: hypothetical protein LBI36_03315 [Oscillospiraceae bacterium]|jgi:hypothetical protein|nr:hypothetical protein [Oscillospiraceae bacterium]
MEVVGSSDLLNPGSDDNKVEDIFRQYMNVVSPYMFELELTDGEFPVEILNEVRAIFTHLAKGFVYQSEEERSRNIDKAGGHVKRAIFDCYKYLCISHLEAYKRFKEYYGGYDLREVDNGEFIIKASDMKKLATDKFFEAKKSELQEGKSDDEIYGLYEEAYNASAELGEYIKQKEGVLQRLKKKDDKKEKRDNFIKWSGWVVGLIGLVMGLIGILG